jgi:glycosyltransferase involved in cell wall biosynthesis
MRPAAAKRGCLAGGGKVAFMTLVVVEMPVYNGEKYLVETLESLQVQSLSNFEIVISDSASTNRTAQIRQSYQAKGPGIRYFQNDWNIGGELNFTRLFELSSAPLFHAGSCDDRYAPESLECCVDALDRDSSAILSHTGTRVYSASTHHND